MMGGVSRRPLCLLRNALVPLSAHASYGAAAAFAIHGIRIALHYVFLLKLLLLTAAGQPIDAIDAVRTLADCTTMPRR